MLVVKSSGANRRQSVLRPGLVPFSSTGSSSANCEEQFRGLAGSQGSVCPAAPVQPSAPIPQSDPCAVELCSRDVGQCLGLTELDCNSAILCSYCEVQGYCTTKDDECTSKVFGAPFISTCTSPGDQPMTNVKFTYTVPGKTANDWEFESALSPGYVFGAQISPYGDEFIARTAFENATVSGQLSRSQLKHA